MTAERDPRRGRDQDGFTLIEVLVALMILAIGLLGLEAMGIGAARAAALSEKESAYTALAAAAMEELRHTVTNGGAPALPLTPVSRRVAVSLGDTALVTGVITSSGTDQATLSVDVVPARAAATPQQVRAGSVRLQSSIWDTNLP